MQLSATRPSSTAMRFLKVIIVALLAAFALLTGIFTALAIAAVGAARSIKRMITGEKASPMPGPSARPPHRARQPAAADVIDVSAVEVPISPADKSA